MEAPENCVENGKIEESSDTADQQYETQKRNLLLGFDEADKQGFDFESHFNGNGLRPDDDFDDTASVGNR